MNDPKEHAIHMTVVFSDGKTGELEELWKKQPVILFFLRHFG
jgi:hypothetical protein